MRLVVDKSKPRPLDDALRDSCRDDRRDTMRGPDGPEGRELAAAVGDNLARHRLRRGVDLDRLAAETHIAVDLLALLEAGEAVPSLRALWALATALEVPFGALVARTGLTGAAFHVRRADRGRLISSASGRFRSRALFPLGDPYAPAVYELTLAPGCFEKAEAHGRNTYEHLTVVRGMLVVYAGEQLARLAAGDSLFFRADEQHSYRNPTSTDTVAHLVMSYA